jgi:hypothetical protein
LRLLCGRAPGTGLLLTRKKQLINIPYSPLCLPSILFYAGVGNPKTLEGQPEFRAPQVHHALGETQTHTDTLTNAFRHIHRPAGAHTLPDPQDAEFRAFSLIPQFAGMGGGREGG